MTNETKLKPYAPIDGYQAANILKGRVLNDPKCTPIEAAEGYEELRRLGWKQVGYNDFGEPIFEPVK